MGAPFPVAVFETLAVIFWGVSELRLRHFQSVLLRGRVIGEHWPRQWIMTVKGIRAEKVSEIDNDIADMPSVTVDKQIVDLSEQASFRVVHIRAKDLLIP